MEQSNGTTNDFLLLQKILDMMEYAYIALRQFPKSEKYALATDIKHCMDLILGYAIFKNILACSSTKRLLLFLSVPASSSSGEWFGQAELRSENPPP